MEGSSRRLAVFSSHIRPVAVADLHCERFYDVSASTCLSSASIDEDENQTRVSSSLFCSTSISSHSIYQSECGVMSKAKRASKLLDGLSDFVLSYEDKDEDWMLVGEIGPIRADDGVGKEIVTQISAKLKTYRTYYTDSNRRDFIKRVLPSGGGYCKCDTYGGEKED